MGDTKHVVTAFVLSASFHSQQPERRPAFMAIFADTLKFALCAWFFALAMIVLFGLFTGRIETKGLLGESLGGRAAPQRVQSLMIVVASAGYYVFLALGADPPIRSLPPVPDVLLASVGGSQLIYLFGKLTRLSTLRR